MFYFITYGLFYLTLLVYKNPLRDILSFAVDFSFLNILYVLYYVGIHGLAIHYFMTAGANPGFVSDTTTSAELNNESQHQQDSGLDTYEEDWTDNSP